MEQDQQKLLNPQAPEFTPFPPSIFSTIPLRTSNNLPLAPPQFWYYQELPPPQLWYHKELPPPQYGYYQQTPPVMMHYHHHHHFLSPPPSLIPSNIPKSHDLKLPFNDDDGVGLITSPIYPSSPLLPNHQPPSSTPRKIPRYKMGTGRIKHHPVWVKKNPEITHDLPANTNDTTPLASYPFGDFTSLMIRNIPVRLSRKELMTMLDEHCRQQNEKWSVSSHEPLSEFDFLYLPVDFRRKGNLGYAFVNFTTWQGASRLYNSWNGTSWDNFAYNTKKTCQIHAAKYQGEKLKKHLKGSVFECETDEYLPVEITPARDGFNGDLTQLINLGTRVSQLKIGR